MPVLNVINQQNISSDTIISPIDNHIGQTISMSPAAASPFPPASSAYGKPNVTSQSPSSYPPLQTEQNYFAQSNQSQASVQRSASVSSTYPPLPNYRPVGWGPVRGNPYANNPIAGFKYEDLQARSQTRDNSNNNNNNNNNRTGFTRPKNILTKLRSPSQPYTGPLYALPGDASHYPSTYNAQVQQTFTSAAETQPVFSYRANPSTFPQQPLVPATAMGFGATTPEMSYSPSPSNMQNIYNPPRHPQQQPGGYSYLQR